MINSGRVLSHLSEAARLIAANKKDFEAALENLVKDSHQDKNADIIGSMLYAAREAISNEDPLS